MVANPQILKKKTKTKTQYTLLQPNLKKLEQQIHQEKQNQNSAHQRQQPMDSTSASGNTATEHIGDRSSHWASNSRFRTRTHRASEIEDRSNRIGDQSSSP